MFDGWDNYYLMVGSSAGALIGLMFVVVTLTAGRDPKELERGKKLYTSPIVWHLAVILVLSGAAAAPVMPVKLFAGIATGLGLLGIMLGIRSAVGISRFFSSTDRAFDAVWYGIAPAVVYVGLVAAGWGMFAGHPWAPAAVSADLMALLLVSIHAEWDLVTYLAPTAGQTSEAAQND
jgi:hypothetical protein